MTKDKYIKKISKQLLCNKEKKNDIIKQITSDINISLENGSNLEKVLSEMGTPKEVADEFNENFDEADKAKIMKSRKRNKIIVVSCLILAVVFIGVYLTLPKAKTLDKSDIFSEEEVISKSKEIVQLIDDGEFDKINEESVKEIQDINLEEKVTKAKNELNKDFGEFVSYGKIYTAEQTQMGKTYAVVQMNVAYKNISVTYTLSFDKDMKLAGIYMK